MVNGTLSRRASVSASSVLPQPVGPISRMLLLASSTSSLRRCSARLGLQALVVVVDGHRQHLLGALLTDDVLVENLLDLVRARQLVARALGAFLELFANDVVAQLDALVANEHRRARDQLANLVLALAAERAVQQLAVVVFAAGIVGPVSCEPASETTMSQPERPHRNQQRCTAGTGQLTPARARSRRRVRTFGLYSTRRPQAAKTRPAAFHVELEVRGNPDCE
jgi:hypothetical protein